MAVSSLAAWARWSVSCTHDPITAVLGRRQGPPGLNGSRHRSTMTPLEAAWVAQTSQPAFQCKALREELGYNAGTAFYWAFCSFVW